MKSLNSWMHGLRGKLLLSALLPVFAFAAITGISLRTMNNLGDMLSSAYTDIIPSMDGVGQIGMQRARVGYFIWAALANKDDFKSRSTFIKKAEEAFEDLKKGQTFYEATPMDEGEIKNYARAKEIKATFYSLTEKMISSLKKNLPEEDVYVHKAMNGGEWHILAIDMQQAIAANMKLYNARSIENDKLQKEKRSMEAQLLVLIASFCATLLFGVLMWIAYRVSKSVISIADELKNSGDLVTSALTQLTAAGNSLSQSSTNAAASLEETVASLEEMSSVVQMNSDNAKQAAALSQSSKESAEQGQTEIQSLIESMHDISKSSKKIEEIISVIDDIAFQTNLLALNASVEAARAGEHGKGFAVVAEAVRALAQRSAIAAKDINVLIKDSVDKVDKGSSVADRSGEVLSKIVHSVKKVADLNNEISAASAEQTTGIQQISKAMNQLDQGSQANAASSEEVAASAEEINTQALHMKKMVVNLNAIIIGPQVSNTDFSSLPKKKPTNKFKGTESTTSFEEKSNVVPFKKSIANIPKHKKTQSKHQSTADIIPFDDDEVPTKVGTTDGF